MIDILTVIFGVWLAVLIPVLLLFSGLFLWAIIQILIDITERKVEKWTRKK